MYQHAKIVKKFRGSNTAVVQYQQNIENYLVSESFEKKERKSIIQKIYKYYEKQKSIFTLTFCIFQSQRKNKTGHKLNVKILIQHG